MTALLFIHGTGVRGDGITAYFDQVRAGLHKIRPALNVYGLPWGDLVGAELLAGGSSIPQDFPLQFIEPLRTMTLATSASEHNAGSQVQLWEILDAAPLAELEARCAERRSPTAAADEHRARIYADRLGLSLEPGTELHRQLALAGLAGPAMAAATQLVASDPFTELATATGPYEEVTTAAFARAFIALLLALRDAELGCSTPLDGVHRTALEETTAQALMQREASIETVHAQFTDALLTGILRLITHWAAQNRLKLIQQNAARIGDALKYLSRPDPLRELIAKRINQIAESQLIIVGHSLGAVAAFDLLLTNRIPKVSTLIAVATQSGLLFELDALSAASFHDGYPVPQNFPLTYFFYDRQDLLSFRAGALAGPRVKDHELDNRAPFPRNHGAYFNNDAFYEALDQLLPPN
ncbi:hypothetical protein [Glutamicibacter uratoxydans]|uniref:hypothetical protein n=1 Tax=Glutamicibacter uratoxydans TaxID=43667 RepID=UPI003D6FC45A